MPLYLHHFGYILVLVNQENPIGQFVKEQRRAAGLTQEEFALRAGVGLRFIRDLEQGKKTVRLDKVNQVLAMFGSQAVPGKDGQ